MLRKTFEGVFTHTWVLLKLWALLCGRNLFVLKKKYFFEGYIKNVLEMSYHFFICFANVHIFYIFSYRFFILYINIKYF